MKKGMVSLRNMLATAAFAGIMVFGTMQAVATNASEPGTRYAGCNSWSCNKECAPFGGSLGSGGPGKPLKCYCCG